MKLHVLSDLHLSRTSMPAAPVVGDVLILAGDISDGVFENTVNFAENYRRANLPVLYVLGNHEFYGKNLARELKFLHRVAPRVGITLLHNRAVVLSNVRFAGTTLWTDFALSGPEKYVEWSMGLVRKGFKDFRDIEHRGRPLTPEATVRFHQRALRFLDRVFATPFKGKTVMITHHGISPMSIHPRFAGNPVNPGFVSDLEPRIKRWRPTLAIHGHVHNRFDYRLGRARVIVNPRGIIREVRGPGGEIRLQLEHSEFDPELVVSI
jgi:Icc-related predicted phosphoesterase